jgi:hypothetical protein
MPDQPNLNKHEDNSAGESMRRDDHATRAFAAGRVAEEQARRNVRTRGTWDQYAAHRERVTQLLVPREPVALAGRLCVLGAGNGNDLDLTQLAAVYDEVHLVDLDAEALEFAIERQPQAARERIVLHGGVDVTGALASLKPSRATIDDAVAEFGKRIMLDPPAPFQAVASVGLLTQLIDAAADAVGREHPRLIEAITALRGSHMRLLIDLLAPGGRGVLITELVSSDTFQALPRIAEEALPQVLSQLLASRNFFTGVNPTVIKSLLESDPLREEVCHVELTLPWRWEFVDRTYAVYAATFTRR